MKKVSDSLMIRTVLTMATAGVVLGSTAMGAEYTWQPTGGGAHNWDVPENWGAGSFPSLSGDIANLNNNITGSQTARLMQSVSVGVLNIGDPDGTNTFKVSSNTDDDVLTFDSGLANTPAQLNVRNVGTVTNEINARVALASDLVITLEPSTTSGNTARISMTGPMTMNNRSLIFTGGYVGGSDQNQISMQAGFDPIGGGALINNSDSPIAISGAKLNFTGKVIANGQGGGGGNTGAFTLTYGSIKNANELVINGATGNNTGNGNFIPLGGNVHIGTGSGNNQVPAHQRLPESRITLNSGFLTNNAVPLAADNTDVYQQDNIQNLDFNSGFSVLNIGSSTTSAGTLMNVTTLERGEGATAVVRMSSPQGTVYASLKATNAASFVVGSTDVSGTATRVVPWIVSSTNASNPGIGTFATYDAVEGFRPLRAGEFSSSPTAGANLTISNAGLNNLAGDLAVNSLVFTHNSTVGMDNTDDGSRVLTITSGGLAIAGSGSSIGAAGDADGKAGTINFGGVEGVIWTTSTNTNGIGARITGTGGINKAGTGTLVLTGANSITGKTHVSGGTLRVGDGTYQSSLGDDDVRVHNGAQLEILSTDVIGDDDTLILDAFGLNNGQVIVGTGLIETVGGLLLGAEAQLAGYYGSSAAAVANPSLSVVINDTFFGGEGLIQVVPEPSAMALLGLALPLAMRRRQ